LANFLYPILFKSCIIAITFSKINFLANTSNRYRNGKTVPHRTFRQFQAALDADTWNVLLPYPHQLTAFQADGVLYQMPEDDSSSFTPNRKEYVRHEDVYLEVPASEEDEEFTMDVNKPKLPKWLQRR
jgi:hypothetical protein